MRLARDIIEGGAPPTGQTIDEASPRAVHAPMDGYPSR